MSDFSANIERFTGFAGLYDDYRPKPPPLIVNILKQLAHTSRPQLVVDLGCGTVGRADDEPGTGRFPAQARVERGGNRAG